MRIEDMKRIAEARTKGEWYYPNDGREVIKDKKGGDLIAFSNYVSERTERKETLANLKFIALAANTYDQLLKVAECAKYIYGEATMHGEDCPGDDYDLPEGEKPGECECGFVMMKKALEELEK